MKQYTTSFQAICTLSGELRTYIGMNVAAPSQELAQAWCREHAGYLKVVGELVSEIPCKEGSYAPDFKKQINYENLN